MSCDVVEESVVALLDGELHGEERRTAELHVASCAACQRELSLLRATRQIVSRHLGVARSTPDGSFDELWRRVEALPDERPRLVAAARPAGRSVHSGRARGRRTAAWAGVGGFAIAAGLALIIVGQQREAVPPGSSPQLVAVEPPRAATQQVAKAEPKPPPRAAQAPAKQKTQLAKKAAAPEPADDDPAGGDVAVVANEVDPPRELLERPELFINYPIVRKLDEMRHLESVLAGASDDGGAG